VILKLADYIQKFVGATTCLPPATTKESKHLLPGVAEVLKSLGPALPDEQIW